MSRLPLFQKMRYQKRPFLPTLALLYGSLILLLFATTFLKQPIAKAAVVDSEQAQAIANGGGSTRIYLPFLSNFVCPLDETGFEATFDEYVCGWEEIAGGWALENGSYVTVGIPESWSSTGPEPEYGNYQMQVRMRRSGCSTCANQVLIHGTPQPLDGEKLWDTFYAFQYKTDGEFSVWLRLGGNDPIPLRSWQFSPAIETGNRWNDITIVASNNTIAVSANDELLWFTNNSIVKSGRVGIGMYRDASSGNRLEIDSASLTAISPPTLLTELAGDWAAQPPPPQNSGTAPQQINGRS